MDDAQPDEELDVEDALQQLLEYQRKIDESAQRVVERVKRMIASREDLEPGFSLSFAKAHGDWYGAIERDLATAGFTSLGAYQNAQTADRPDDKRSFYRFAVSEDRTIVANWFVVPVAKPLHCVVLESWTEDGAGCATTSGIKDNGLPRPPQWSARLLAANTPIASQIAEHREQLAALNSPVRRVRDMDEVLANREESADAYSEYREELGLKLFEPMLRAMYGDSYEDEGTPILESIQNHPEWWTGEKPGEEVVERPTIDAAQPLRIGYFMSRDEESGRGHMTTAGLAFRGVPDLQMKGLAANHCLAARFVMSIVSRKLVAYASELPRSEEPLENRLDGIELVLTRADVPNAPVDIRATDASLAGPVPVRLTLEEFGGEGGKVVDIFSVLLAKKRAPKLLRIHAPPGDSRDADTWLRNACERLGLSVPPALPLSAFEETMSAASKFAVRDLADLRRRLDAGLREGQVVAIKTGLEAEHGGREFVWIKVTEWPEGAFVGTLEVQPHDLPGYLKGQTLRVADADVFDRGIFTASGEAIEPPFTDLVAQDFGVDLPSR